MFWSIVSILGIFIYYCSRNDGILGRHPQAEALSPKRWTPEDVDGLAEKHAQLKEPALPPKTGRRYIVTGGVGFVGGHVVMSLVRRGEDPKNIRILDIRPPIRRDLLSSPANQVQFIKVDITDPKAVLEAFEAPWPEGADTSAEITVFHTAANIRHFERLKMFLPRSMRINVDGTKNVIEASAAIGATILLSTSSCTLAIFRQRLLLWWPWESAIKYPVPILTDDEHHFPKRFEDSVNNYAHTKLIADGLVRAADRRVGLNGKTMRTGTLRIGTFVYGPGGNAHEHCFVNGGTPIFIHDIFQNHCYVENAVLAHLCYEQRLIELAQGRSSSDVGGQGFMITDPGPPVLGLDWYTALDQMTGGKLWYVYLSPTFLILLSHIVEWYYVFQEIMPRPFRWFILKISGEIVNMQPSTFGAAQTGIVDDSRARLPPEKGGLGYDAPWNTLDGMYRTWVEYRDHGTLEPKSRGHAYGFTSR